jgi:uncharacterized membrane protein
MAEETARQYASGAQGRQRHYGSSRHDGGFRDDVDRLTTGLGWFSIGLGFAEVVAPGKMAQLIGIREETRTKAVMRLYGFREIAAGVGILSQPRPAGWMWGRVAGDILDLASLGKAMKSRSTSKARVGAATAAVMGVTALDVLCSERLSHGTGWGVSSRGGRVRIVKSIRVNRSPEEVYRFWHDFENLAKFMSNVESVQVMGDRRSHWRVKAPGGRTVDWDAEIVQDVPNSLIAWRSLSDSDVDNSGSVRFESAPGGRGSIVRVELEYVPPLGVIGADVAKLFGRDPGQQVEEDLLRFKQIMETGEVVQSDASIFPGMHPAQPPERVPETVRQSETVRAPESTRQPQGAERAESVESR